MKEMISKEVGKTQLTVGMLHTEMREQHYLKKMDFIREVAGNSPFLKGN